MRLRRVEQSERNRALVLAAARAVFMDRGYHGATLEQIAEAAGFSKGVVYSRFESKADLFLSLLAAVAERSGEQLTFVPAQMAEVALALATGMLLEQAADPEAMGGRLAGEVLTRVIAGSAATVRRRGRRHARTAAR